MRGFTCSGVISKYYSNLTVWWGKNELCALAATYWQTSAESPASLASKSIFLPESILAAGLALRAIDQPRSRCRIVAKTSSG